jgi:Nif-specific regulatory protein
VLSTGPAIEPRDLPILESEPAAPADGWPKCTYHEAVLAFKRDFLRSALSQAKGNQTRAAETLGLQRTYLSRLIKELRVREANS